MRAQWSCPTVGTFSPSSLPKLLAASAVAVTVTLSTATVAHAARHEDPWNPNSWAPEVTGGAVGGAGGSGLLLYYLLKDIKKDTENTAKESDLHRLREYDMPWNPVRVEQPLVGLIASASGIQTCRSSTCTWKAP